MWLASQIAAIKQLAWIGAEIAEAQTAAELLQLKLSIWELETVLKYNPDQLRVPAGRPGGGQWTRTGEGEPSSAGGDASGVEVSPTWQLRIGRDAEHDADGSRTQLAANDRTANDANGPPPRDHNGPPERVPDATSGELPPEVEPPALPGANLRVRAAIKLLQGAMGVLSDTAVDAARKVPETAAVTLVLEMIAESLRHLEATTPEMEPEARLLRELGLSKNTMPVWTEEGSAIPDALTADLLIEIKDTATVTLTRQLRIMIGAARDTGRTSLLYVGPNTEVAAEVAEGFTDVKKIEYLGPRVRRTK